MQRSSKPGVLNGKTVLVTGGAGILGRHLCRGFSQAGATVAVLDLDMNACRKVAGSLGNGSFGVECDITDSLSVTDAMQFVVSQRGNLDVLVNNAASKSSDVRAFFASFEEYELETWREVMSVNIDGLFLITQAASRQFLMQSTGGNVINMASIYGLVGPDPGVYVGSNYLGGAINTPAVYSASKAAVVGLTKWLATHWGPHGIRANCLVPGGVSSGQNDAFQERYSARTPMGRMAEADEIVDPAVFLASDAARYITGQVLAADGGWTAW